MLIPTRDKQYLTSPYFGNRDRSGLSNLLFSREQESREILKPSVCCCWLSLRPLRWSLALNRTDKRVDLPPSKSWRGPWVTWLWSSRGCAGPAGRGPCRPRGEREEEEGPLWSTTLRTPAGRVRSNSCLPLCLISLGESTTRKHTITQSSQI